MSAPSAGATLRQLDVERLVREEPPPVPWIVEGLVVRGMLTVLNGREGEGKSLLATCFAAGVATGQREAGLECARGGVMIVDAENGESEIHRRVRNLGLPSDEVTIFEAQGFDLRRDLPELDGCLAEYRPALLVLDSFRTLWGGEENDSREVSAVLDPLRNLVRRHQTGALLLHHSAKTNAAYRGSSAIGASCELGFALARRADDPDPARCYIETWKCRPAERPPRRWLRLSVEREKVFIDACDPPDEEGRTVSAPVRDDLRPLILTAMGDDPMTRADVARAVDRDPRDRSVGRVLSELVDAGVAERAADGWRLADSEHSRDGCHPATAPKAPHSQEENGGGNLLASDMRAATEAEEADIARIREKFEMES